MTPQERAEKMIQAILVGVEGSYFNFFLTHLEEAQREAVKWKVKEILSEPGMMIHWKDGHDKGYAEGFRAGVEHANTKQGDTVTLDLFKLGFNAAREKAKGIAETLMNEKQQCSPENKEHDIRWCPTCESMEDAYGVIAQLIGNLTVSDGERCEDICKDPQALGHSKRCPIGEPSTEGRMEP